MLYAYVYGTQEVILVPWDVTRSRLRRSLVALYTRRWRFVLASWLVQFAAKARSVKRIHVCEEYKTREATEPLSGLDVAEEKELAREGERKGIVGYFMRDEWRAPWCSRSSWHAPSVHRSPAAWWEQNQALANTGSPSHYVQNRLRHDGLTVEIFCR